ncbi:MAG: hypothetical protein ACREM6_14525 [Vulcanimicrobiaceae bacterium]
MTVAMAMRSFPWLHFHLAGGGRHDGAGDYEIHFTRMPFFARGMDHIDLSTLDPTTWSTGDIVTVIAHAEDETTFALSPRAAGSVSSGRVMLEPRAGLEIFDLRYAGGPHIVLDLNLREVAGLHVPVNGVAEIDLRHLKLFAHVTFSDYAIEPAPPATFAAVRPRSASG